MDVPADVVLIRAFVVPDSRFRLSGEVLPSAPSNGAMLGPGMGMGMLWVLVDWVLVNPCVAKLATNLTTFILDYMLRAVPT